MRRLSVVILNYGTPDLAIACAKSALADIAGLNAGIVLVDNASPDDSAAKLSHWRVTLPSEAPVEIVLSQKNTGYAGGNNIGIRAREAEFHVLLNSDALVRRGTFAAMLSAMDGDAGLGAVSPRLVDGEGREQPNRFRFHSPFGEFVEGSGLDVLHRLFRFAVVPIFPGEAAEPRWISFPCVMLRRKMIDEIGLLDEGYFLYFEDCDYCRRAAKRGWRVDIAEKGEVAHFIGSSSKVEEKRLAGARLPVYYYAARTRYFRKWHGRSGYVAANLLWLLGRAVGNVRRLAGRAPPPAPAHKAEDIWIGQDEGRPATQQ